MKILTGAQIRELDKYTIEHEPVKSVDLMERAAEAIFWALVKLCSGKARVVVFAGPGNNGGDALAVARKMAEKGYSVEAYLFNIGNKLSADCATNRQRLQQVKQLKAFVEVTDEFDPPELTRNTFVIDGLFGSGLNKPLAGGFASLVKYINQSEAKVASIDIPSGLMTEDNSYNARQNIIQADYTLTLQHRKLAFLFAENQQFIGKLKVLDIQLSAEGEAKIDTPYTIVEDKDIRPLIRRRGDFWHKGNAGSALLVAGSYGMAGAAILAARACLRAGAGKVTVHTPRLNNSIMQVAVPEAIVSNDIDDHAFTEAVAADDFDAMGIGPGLGTKEDTATALISQIRRTQSPIVIDADALNILATHRAWQQQLPPGTILTPHPREFERLTGVHFNNSYESLAHAMEMAQNLNIYIILKGHHSALCMPDGRVAFNSTGNAGMATAGSGDVLTGIITGLLARGYTPREACLIGMYLHGEAGDIAAKALGMESLTASDITDCLPKAFRSLSGDTESEGLHVMPWSVS